MWTHDQHADICGGGLAPALAMATWSGLNECNAHLRATDRIKAAVRCPR